MAPSVLFTNNAVTHDMENNNTSIETTKNAQDFCLHIAAQFKVRQQYIDNMYISVSQKCLLLLIGYVCYVKDMQLPKVGFNSWTSLCLSLS